MIMIKLLRPLGGKPIGALITVTPGVAAQLTSNGSAALVTKP